MVVRRLTGLLLIFCALLKAQVPAELPELDAWLEPGTVTAVASPLDAYQRGVDDGGMLWGDAWNPWVASAQPQWQLGGWNGAVLDRWSPVINHLVIATGNEVGDAWLQELMDSAGQSTSNRTPSIHLEVGSPAWSGWNTFVSFRQIDHFGSHTLKDHRTQVGYDQNPEHTWAWFGENLPAYSSLRGGLTYVNESFRALLMVGQDYTWKQNDAWQWTALKTTRWGGALNWKKLELLIWRDSVETADSTHHLQSSLVTDQVRLAWRECGLQMGMDVQKRRQGVLFPRRYSDDWAVVPWAGLDQSWGSWLFRGWLGGNPEGWRGADTLELLVPLQAQLGAYSWDMQVSSRGQGGTQAGLFGVDTQWVWKNALESKGVTPVQSSVAWVQDLKVQTRLRLQFWTLTLQLIPWVQGGVWYREWDRDSLPEWQYAEAWIQGFRKNVLLSADFRQFFRAELGWSHETRQGEGLQYVEWQPARQSAWISGDWRFSSGLSLLHQLQWQSASRWQLQSYGFFETQPEWSWNVMIRQEFPRQRLRLEATWIHVLSKDQMTWPQGNEDRTRFMVRLHYGFE